MFLQNACVRVRMAPERGHLCHIVSFFVPHLFLFWYLGKAMLCAVAFPGYLTYTFTAAYPFISPVSIFYKSIAGRYWPVRVADGPIAARINL